MSRNTLEFLFIGPLFSMFKLLNQIRRDLVSLQETVDSLVSQLAKAKAEIVTKISELEAQVAAGETPDLTALKEAVQALDDVVPDSVPEPEPEPETEEPVQ